MENIDTLSFEQARDELRQVIQVLESGSAPLEKTLELWKRGESLAQHCRAILESALREVQQSATAPDGPSQHNSDSNSEV